MARRGAILAGPSAHTVVWCALGLTLLSCGARTGLPGEDGSLEPCELAGHRRRCETICGEGVETCIGGFWQGCTAPRPLPPVLPATIRDLSASHPDFEALVIGDDRGIVRETLGADDTPVYAGQPTTLTTHGREAFNGWFHDVPGLNATTMIDIPLGVVHTGPLVFGYSDEEFFPIDDQLIGNDGRPHNFHFTLELSTRFRYVGGETFTFEGDDDVWVFINRHLVIDLGGVHATESDVVDLDERAAELALRRGGVYPLHLFYAERHTVGSTFRVETSIAEFDSCN